MAKNVQLSLRLDIKELRTKFGLSQQELADKTGIPKGRINGWEQMGSHPKAADTATLRNFFNKLEGIKQTADPQENSGNGLAEENRLLKMQLADKEEIIALLKEKIKTLEDR